MAEEEGEVVVDRALPVVQIRVADPAGLYGDEHLTRAGIGHHDCLHLDGCALFHSDYGTDLVWHDQLLCCCAMHDGLRYGRHSENAIMGPSRGVG